jgi:ribose-phosphate pyrophosphokinase
VGHVVTVDLHSRQGEGFFRIPIDNLSAVPSICAAMREVLPEGVVVVSPDAGRMKLAAEYAGCLGTRAVAVLHKGRENGERPHVTHIAGDVAGRACLVIDDLISTGGTILAAIDALLRAGARPGIYVAATHGLLVAGAAELLEHPALAELFITDTVPRPACCSGSRLRVVSVAPLIAAAIRGATSGVSHGEPT